MKAIIYIISIIGLQSMAYSQRTISSIDFLADTTKKMADYERIFSGLYITDDEARKYEGHWIAPYQDGFIVFTLVFKEKKYFEELNFHMDGIFGYYRISPDGQKPAILISDPKGKFPPYTREPDFYGNSHTHLILGIGAGNIIYNPEHSDQFIFRFQKHEWFRVSVSARRRPWWVGLDLPENEDIIFTRMAD
jgi:hypothetical protein